MNNLNQTSINNFRWLKPSGFSAATDTFRVFTVVMVMMMLTVTSYAQTTFNALIDDDWYNPDNWTNGLPNENNAAYIEGGLEVNFTEDMSLNYNLSLLEDAILNNYANLTIGISNALSVFESDASFNNYGVLNVEGIMYNFSTVYLENEVNVSGVIINAYTGFPAVLCNNANLTVDSIGEVQNEGIWHNEATMNNNGEMLNAGYLLLCGAWTGNDPSPWAGAGYIINEGCDDFPECQELQEYLVSAVVGCTDETACNYNPEAIIDDGSCLEDIDNDGICEDCENFEIIVVDCDCEFFDPVTYTVFFVEVDEEMCTLIENCNCECINDIDNDGICDENEITGCTDPDACNYDPSATDDDGSCTGEVVVYPVEGNMYPEILDATTYIYSETAGSAYEWTCDGGTILSGNGTNQVEVLWDSVDIGLLCVTETTSEQCIGTMVCIEVYPSTVGVNEFLSLEVEIYPNPASEYVTIKWNQFMEGVTYHLLDSSGKLVRQGIIQKQDVRIETSDLAAGKYVLRTKKNSMVGGDIIFLK